MDAATRTVLFTLLRGERIGALGTLRQGAPLVSMLPFLLESSPCTFVLHVSRLAWHTQDMLQDPRVSLSIAEKDDGRADPYLLARVSIRGECMQLANEGGEYEDLKAAWLARHPATHRNFELADFSFWRLAPRDARFVAGYGSIHNVAAEDLHA
jgi:putative heme iron utilization protein